MAKLPVCTGRDAIRVFEVHGWVIDRQKGSRVSLVKTGALVVLTVPLHETLDRGLLRGLIRKTGLKVSEFSETLVGKK